MADVVLHFCHSHHCAACELAKPDLERFEAKHSSKVLVVKHNVALFPWRPGGEEITKTPTYVLTDIAGNKLKEPVVGALTLKQLEKHFLK